MRINHNISALNTKNTLSKNQKASQKTLEKLSSGYKINRAGDDAAGLAISEKMRSQIRGLEMAGKNIQDGISLVQTAEGAMEEIHSILHRGRELMVQAVNDTNTDDEREMIQQEVEQLLEEINRISDTTNFNNIALLKTDILPPPVPGGGGGGSLTGLVEPPVDPNLPVVTLNSNATLEQKIATVLKYSMLEQGEKRISDYFGLQASNVNMNVIYTNEPNASYLAYVSYYLDSNGEGNNLTLAVNKGYFQQAGWPDGGTYPMYLDRVITHELTHAVMAVTTNFGSLPGWFKEGTAEFIHGADERLALDIYYAGGGEKGAANVVKKIGDISTSAGYSAGYVAVRYLHDKLKNDFNYTGGIKDLMSKLTQTDTKTGKKYTLDAALKELSNGVYSNTNAFLNDFKANGVDYIKNMDLTNADTGAIGGLDADGGAEYNARTVVDDTLNYKDQPLSGFTLKWPTGLESVNVGTVSSPYTTLNSGFNYWESNSLSVLSEVNIQLGANGGQTTAIELTTINSTTLGISGVDAVNDADNSITIFDQAIQITSSKRAYFGAIQNRLEHSYNNVMNTAENLTAAESRIRDTDMAKEMMDYTKMNILIQASQAMLSQANQQPQGVLQLLN